MKKVLMILGAFFLIALSAGGYWLTTAYERVMGGDEYYVQIKDNGEEITLTDDNGSSYTDYKYNLTGFDESGTKKELSFNANKNRPLRNDAFLKVTWNKEKGVTRYEEVPEKDVPSKSLELLTT